MAIHDKKDPNNLKSNMISRMWTGEQMWETDLRWDYYPMSSLSLPLKNKDRVFENDILTDSEKVMIVRKGVFEDDGVKLCGWYLDIYEKNNLKTKALDLNKLKDYRYIGNIYENSDMYEDLKNRRWKTIKEVLDD